jgi:hypothetical protein
VSLERIDPFPGVELSWRLTEPGRARLDFTLPAEGADVATLKGTLLQNVESTLSILEGAVYDVEDAQWPVEAAPARIQPAGPVPAPPVLLP